jgi:hypothetical protein
MSHSPFIARTLESPGMLNKLLGRQSKTNALVELNNRLVEAPTVRDVTLDTVHELNTKYQVDLHRRFDHELKQLYRSFLFHCLADREFSQDEIDDLWHLKALFGITDAEHESLYQEAAQETYKKTLNEVLNDRKVTDNEKALLGRLSAYLRIPESVRDKIHEKTAGPVIQQLADQFTSDNQLSPQEDQELNALARSLGITLTSSAGSTAALNTMRMLWRINNAPLPVLETHLNLQRGETVHFTYFVRWYEHRKVTTRVNYGGPSLRIKICKGFYWNTGSMDVRRVSEDVLKEIDSGHLWVTNKRIIFDGGVKNQSIKLEKILDFTRYSDAVEIEKETGKSPVLFCDCALILSATLARVIRDLP